MLHIYGLGQKIFPLRKEKKNMVVFAARNHCKTNLGGPKKGLVLNLISKPSLKHTSSLFFYLLSFLLITQGSWSQFIRQESETKNNSRKRVFKV